MPFVLPLTHLADSTDEGIMPPEKAATYHVEKDTPYTIAPPTVCSVLIIRLITHCGVTSYHTSWGKGTSLRLLLPMFHSQIWQPWLHVFFFTQHSVM